MDKSTIVGASKSLLRPVFGAHFQCCSSGHRVLVLRPLSFIYHSIWLIKLTKSLLSTGIGRLSYQPFPTSLDIGRKGSIFWLNFFGYWHTYSTTPLSALPINLGESLQEITNSLWSSWLLNPAGIFPIQLGNFLEASLHFICGREACCSFCVGTATVWHWIYWKISSKVPREAVRQPESSNFGFSGLATPLPDKRKPFFWLFWSITIYHQLKLKYNKRKHKPSILGSEKRKILQNQQKYNNFWKEFGIWRQRRHLASSPGC